MAGPHIITYALDYDASLIIEPLDAMTVIYHRRSGITHLVAEPVPQILAVMGSFPETAQDVARRLAAAFDFRESADAATEIVAARLAEMADLGLLERSGA